MNHPVRRQSADTSAFTLVELMVSVAIIGLIMVVLVQMTGQISNTWRNTTGKIEQFQEARAGFESLTRKLSQATLNTHWALIYGTQISGHQNITGFTRQSELRFICGPMSSLSPNYPAQSPTHGIFFQAPLGYVDQQGTSDLPNLLNTWGYFIQASDDAPNDPPFLPQAYQKKPGYRLMELMVPTENMTVYNDDPNRHDAQNTWPSQQKPPGYNVPGSVGNYGQLGWFQAPLQMTKPPTRVLSENIIALILWPKLSKQDEDTRRTKGYSTLSPNYTYDSSTLTFSTNPATSATTLPTGTSLNLGAVVTSAGDPSDAGGITPRAQLPPTVQVTMVALDVASARRLFDINGNSLLPSYDAFTRSLFAKATSGAVMPGPGQYSQYDTDLGDMGPPNWSATSLEYTLSNPSTIAPALGVAPLKYRVFTSNVAIRGAKWSSYEGN